MGNTLYLVSNRERCEGKRAVAVFWLELCNISTVSLDSKTGICRAKATYVTTDIALSVWGYVA